MAEKIVISPKIKTLSAPELISLRSTEIGSLKVGLKKTKPDGSSEEAAELNRIYGELKKQLSAPRIDKLCGRSEGEWDFDRNAVKIIRKEGKFKVFGYFLNEDHYLEDYEALFLLELNRLEVLYSSVRMSVEQAYALLLGEEHSIKYNNYLVYSLFSRVGFIVQRYRNLSFSAKEPTAEDCIWSILLNSVQNKPITDRVRNSEHFAKVEMSMNNIRSKIMSQDSPITADDSNYISFQRKVQPSTEKRKAYPTGPSNSKRARYDHDAPQTHSSFITFLTKEEEYKRFESIFQSFDMIRLRAQFDYDETQPNELTISFDVYQHNDNFKKSEPKPPAFRLAILEKDQQFPTRADISRCYHSQELRVPVLVISVSESKHVQGFLFHFT